MTSEKQLICAECGIDRSTSNIGRERQALGVASCPGAGVRAVVDLHERPPAEQRGREPDVARTGVQLEDGSGAPRSPRARAAHALCSNVQPEARGGARRTRRRSARRSTGAAWAQSEHEAGESHRSSHGLCTQHSMHRAEHVFCAAQVGYSTRHARSGQLGTPSSRHVAPSRTESPRRASVPITPAIGAMPSSTLLAIQSLHTAPLSELDGTEWFQHDPDVARLKGDLEVRLLARLAAG